MSAKGQAKIPAVSRSVPYGFHLIAGGPLYPSAVRESHEAPHGRQQAPR